MKCRKLSKPTEAAAQHGHTRSTTAPGQRQRSHLQHSTVSPARGTSGQGGPAHGQGRPRGCSTAGVAVGMSALSDMAMGKHRETQAQRKDLCYHKFSFAFLILEWMAAATLPFIPFVLYELY